MHFLLLNIFFIWNYGRHNEFDGVLIERNSSLFDHLCKKSPRVYRLSMKSDQTPQ